jgi:hypothetical protein
MTKAVHRTIQLLLIVLCVPIGGFYYYYYNKNREIDDYRLQLWAEMKNGSISKHEYYRLWDPKVEEWKESFRKCELLDIPAVAVFLLSGANLIVFLKNKSNHTHIT